MTDSIPPPQTWYSCHQCGLIHEAKAFRCICGFIRTGNEKIRHSDREMVRLAWRQGRDEAWISSKFNCSNRQAKLWKPSGMKPRRLRVM